MAIELIKILINLFLQFDISDLDRDTMGLQNRNTLGLYSQFIDYFFEWFAHMAVLVIDVFIWFDPTLLIVKIFWIGSTSILSQT